MKKSRWVIVAYLPPSPDWMHEFFGIILKPIKMNDLLSTLQKCRSSEKLESPSQTLMDMKRLSKANQILLVEDNLANQKLTALMINRIGYEVDIACNGVEAVEKTKENEYSLILMDCHMPVMDGFQATSIIRETEKKSFLKRTPIVSLSANVSAEFKQLCMNSQMDGYLPKPIKRDDLQAIIKKYVGAPCSTDSPFRKIKSWNRLL